VAVTDHDRLHPELAQPISTRDGVEIIHGIELRVESADQRLDLLGYGVQRTDRLEALIEQLQTNRIERANAIIECVEERLGVDLTVSLEAGVGRPHIARAIDESDAKLGYKDAFRELIGDGGPCYVPREIPAFERGHEVLAESCRVVGLAHPLRYEDPGSALERAAELDAIELHYPYERDTDDTALTTVIKEYDLLATGGSDAHGTVLGETGLDRTAYRTVREQIA
jgi:predicted metal-dependent phosphoesterase TrpH